MHQSQWFPTKFGMEVVPSSILWTWFFFFSSFFLFCKKIVVEDEWLIGPNLTTYCCICCIDDNWLIVGLFMQLRLRRWFMEVVVQLSGHLNNFTPFHQRFWYKQELINSIVSSKFFLIIMINDIELLFQGWWYGGIA